ncbi:MAG: pirin family protein [Mycobacteriaceae bacterium]
MSNLELIPEELTCCDGFTRDPSRGRVLDFRSVPLGGPRAMTVRRTLPQREQSLIGAWCFIDHFGPDDVSATGGMIVPGHPHTGLQTVSWLFRGTVDHLDSVGTSAVVRPGEVNLMTAGAGIAHSEYSTPTTAVLHGVQLWLALPDKNRFTEPRFEHYAPPVLDCDGATVLVFLGTLFGDVSPVLTYSPVLGAEITLQAGQTLRMDVDTTFEHGVLVDTGAVTVARTSASSGQLVHVPAGVGQLTLTASADEEARVLLLGGEPLGEEIVMWWNFIGRTHEEIVAYRKLWQLERAGEGGNTARFGQFPVGWERTLAAPAIPNARLKPRK